MGQPHRPTAIGASFRRAIAWAVFGLGGVAALLTVSGCRRDAAPAAAADGTPAAGSGAGAAWKLAPGIAPLGVRLSAGGYMLDFRYRVTDPEAARPLLTSKVRPYLLDEKTGARLFVPVPPKTGALRSTRPPVRGRTYAMLFANPGRFLRPDSQVRVVFGDYRSAGLVVQ